MNNETRIDTEKLQEQLNRIIEERDKLNTLLENIKKETDILKDFWETKTSDSVFNNFTEFYTGLQQHIDAINSDIEFLESTIKNYKEYEEKANKQIDENIAI